MVRSPKLLVSSNKLVLMGTIGNNICNQNCWECLSLSVMQVCSFIRNLEPSNRTQADKGGLKKNKVGFVNSGVFPGC